MKLHRFNIGMVPHTPKVNGKYMMLAGKIFKKDGDCVWYNEVKNLFLNDNDEEHF